MSDNVVSIDQKQLDAAEKMAIKAGDVFIHKMKKPIQYNGQTIDSIRFNFADLTGKDYLAIEAELNLMGKPTVSAVFSGEFLVRMAARSGTPKLGVDGYEQMCIYDFNRIRSAARSFLLKSES